MATDPDRSMDARLDLRFCLLDGMFSPQKREAGQDLRVRKVACEFDHFDKGAAGSELEGGSAGVRTINAVRLSLTIPATLGVRAETLLLAILHLMEMRGNKMPPEDCSTDGALTLRQEGAAKSETIGRFSTTEWELLKISGMDDSAKSYAALRKDLLDLSRIHIHFKNTVTRFEGASSLLAYAILPDPDQSTTDRVVIDINWRMAGAIFGRYLYARINLADRHKLTTEAAKVLHRWLSGHIWKGKRSELNLETLAQHVWSDTVDKNAQRLRYLRLRRALCEIAGLEGWKIRPDPRIDRRAKKYEIERE